MISTSSNDQFVIFGIAKHVSKSDCAKNLSYGKFLVFMVDLKKKKKHNKTNHKQTKNSGTREIIRNPNPSSQSYDFYFFF